MRERWEEECADLRAELAVVRDQLHALAASQPGANVSAPTPSRGRLSKSMTMVVVPVVVLLAAGGVLYGQGPPNALFIDKDGKVGIGRTDPNHTLDVKGTLNVTDKATLADTNIKGTLTTGKVGVGTDPKHTLDVKGTLGATDTATLANTQITGTLTTTGKVQIVNKNQDGNGDTLILGPIAQSNLRLGYNADYGWVQSQGAKPLALNPAGNNVGIGTANVSKDKLDVAGSVRVLSDTNPVRFTSKWSGFPDKVVNQAEISNDTTGYKVLMIAGNKSGGGTLRRVGVWDQLEMHGDLFVYGRLAYQSGTEWKQVYQERDGWAGSRGTTGPAPSDLRLKREVHSVWGALDKIRQLRGVTYRWNDSALQYFARDIESTISAGPHATEAENQKLWRTERDKRYKELGQTQVGVVAQDVEAVLPEAVITDEAGYKWVRYHYLIALLIEALKEQEKTVNDQARVVVQHQQEIARLTAANRTVQQHLAELAAVKTPVARLDAVIPAATGLAASNLTEATKE